MRSVTWAAVIMGLTLAAAGCENHSDNPAGGVGIVNLERIAVGSGQAQVIEGKRQARVAEIQAELVRVETELKAELDKQTKAAGDSPTAEQKESLEQLKRKHMMMMQQGEARAQQVMGGYQRELVQQFQQSIMPAAQKVMHERGITVLMQANPTVLAADPSADLTEAIIRELNERKTTFGDGGPGPGAAPGLAPVGPGGPGTQPGSMGPGPVGPGPGPGMPPAPGSGPAAPPAPVAPPAPQAPAAPAPPAP